MMSWYFNMLRADAVFGEEKNLKTNMRLLKVHMFYRYNLNCLQAYSKIVLLLYKDVYVDLDLRLVYSDFQAL